MRIVIAQSNVENGGSIVVEGTGCVDPATGTSEGLWAGAGVGFVWVIGVAAVRRDGSFTIRGTMNDSVRPGVAQVSAYCSSSSSPEYPTSDTTISTSPTISVTVKTPYTIEIAPAIVRAGGTVDVRADCPQRTTPDYEYLSLHVDPWIGGSEYLPAGRVSQGRARAMVRIPETAAPGEYTVTAACGIERTPTIRYYKPFTLTVEEPTG